MNASTAVLDTLRWTPAGWSNGMSPDSSIWTRVGLLTCSIAAAADVDSHSVTGTTSTDDPVARWPKTSLSAALA